MTLILSGTDGLSDVDGTAATPAIRGTDANTGIFFPAADTIAFSEGGAESMRINSSGQLDLVNNPILTGGTANGVAFLNASKVLTTGSALQFDGTNAYISNALSIGGATPSAGNKLLVRSGATDKAVSIDNGSNAGFIVQFASSLTSVGNDFNAPLAFLTNNAERARILSGGNFLIGATSTANDEKLGVYQTANSAAIFINPSNASYNGTALYINTTRAASNAFDFIGCYGNNVGQFRVVGDGVIYAQNTSVQSISDQRLKENIRDSSDGLAVVNALRPVRYDWKAGYGNNQKNQLGFIAQEIETVFPEAVSEWQVNKDDETVYKTVGPGTLIPVLVKAIQEQQAIIESLKARLDAANL